MPAGLGKGFAKVGIITWPHCFVVGHLLAICYSRHLDLTTCASGNGFTLSGPFSDTYLSRSSSRHFNFPHNPPHGCLLFFARRRLSSTQSSCTVDPRTTSHDKPHGCAAAVDYSGNSHECGPVQDEHRVE